MTETVATFHDPDMLTITDLGTDRPKTEWEMTYFEKNKINEAICEKLRKEDVYK